MAKKYRYTFDSWNEGECSEVRNVPLDEAAGYQSEYVYKFNWLRENGWTRMNGRWVNPRPPYQTYGTLELAWGSQKYYEHIMEENESPN